MTMKERVMMAERSQESRRLRVVLVWAAIVAAVSFALYGCGSPGPGSASTSEELLAQLQQDRARIDQTSETMMKRIETFNASRQPGERTLQFSEVFTQDLSPEQRDVLDTLMLEESDISYKALLQQIIADRDSIRTLQEKVMHLEQTLPDKFVVARKGDTHQGLAMAYLTGEAGLDEARAKEQLKQIDQTDELLAGNQVWFFFDAEKGTFRTYVTAGSAGMTPVMVRRARTRELLRERDAYRKERDSAHEQVASLENDRLRLEEEISTNANSLRFYADSDQSLKRQGVLSAFLRRLRDVEGISYDQSVDLARETSIELDAQDFGLEQIRSVRILPSIYREGRDFAVEIDADRSGARVEILNPDLFKGKEVLLAIRG